MTNLERRALLGDAEAQRECTEKGIVLACPRCYGRVSIIGVSQTTSMDGMTFVCDNGCTGVMGVTLTQSFVHSAVDRRPLNPSPLAQWNTRPAPPIGRCGECVAYIDNKCANTGYYKPESGFCNDFYPKGGEENAVD